MSNAPWGHPRMASAVDRGLIDGLRERLARRRVKLGALRPLLMAAYNAARQRLGDSATLVLLEPTRLCLIRTEQQRWQHVVVRRVGTDAARTIDQELATLSGSDPEPPLVALLVGRDVQWPIAPSRVPKRVARYSLACCAAM